MGVLLPNYPEENIVKGENVPNFKVNTGTSDGTSKVFQILQDLQLKQYQYQYNSNTVPNMLHTMNTAQMAQLVTSFRTSTPFAPATTDTTTKQVDPVHVHENTSWIGPPAHCAHVYESIIQVCKPGESLALRKVKHPQQWKDFCEQTPIDEARHSVTLFWLLWRYRMFSRGPIQISPQTRTQASWHAPRKVPIHLGATFKEKIKSLVKPGILEKVKEHTDWVNSYMIVEKDTGSHLSPNHTIKKLRICLDPRDLNKALEREPYHWYCAEIFMFL